MGEIADDHYGYMWDELERRENECDDYEMQYRPRRYQPPPPPTADGFEDVEDENG